MQGKAATRVHPNLADLPFSKLLEVDRELADLRRNYESQSSEDRRKAADWQYGSACAADMIERAAGQRLLTGDALGAWGGYVSALAIDPQHGPAMLTVGAIEYQLGRVDEALALLLRLTELDHDESLPEIIDKAGDFLIDQDDLAGARRLFQAAADRHPQVAIYHVGLGYCAGQNGRFDEAVQHTRRAVDLEPDNYLHLSDLGYCLTQAGHYDEAERVLRRAVELAPPDYEMARGNLKHLEEVRG